jgi:hypothetical protein
LDQLLLLQGGIISRFLNLRHNSMKSLHTRLISGRDSLAVGDFLILVCFLTLLISRLGKGVFPEDR